MLKVLDTAIMFYSYHNLQGSQTHLSKVLLREPFYSYHNLQGSQTSNGYLQTYPSGKWYKL